ncbi:MAG: DUF134 domain-containing protein [Candidatus Bathyarchaeia archaeon]
MMHRRRHRHGKIGRPPKPVVITVTPSINKLKPIPQKNCNPVYLSPAEIEALRLVDLDGLSFEETGKKMNVSRNTVWRLIKEARQKIVRAIMEGREILIEK